MKLALSGLTAQAETLISTRTLTLPVDISSAKVVITNKGYGSTYLVKILVPALAAPTLMNHRNEGETAPCLATYETNKISDIVQDRPEVVQAELTINLKKSTSLDDQAHVCHVYLTEEILTTVRGYHFTHVRSNALPDRDPADCQE